MINNLTLSPESSLPCGEKGATNLEELKKLEVELNNSFKSFMKYNVKKVEEIG